MSKQTRAKLNYFKEHHYTKEIRSASFIHTTWGILLGYAISCAVGHLFMSIQTDVTPKEIVLFFMIVAFIVALIIERMSKNFPDVENGFYRFKFDVYQHARHVLDEPTFNAFWHEKEYLPSYFWESDR